jgi:hypothetical protein
MNQITDTQKIGHSCGLLYRRAPAHKVAARTVDDLYTAVAHAIDAITPAECANYFQSCGYNRD